VEGEESPLPGGARAISEIPLWKGVNSNLVSGPTGQGTVSGRQFLWGSGLPKGNGGVQRFPRAGRRLALECKGGWVLQSSSLPPLPSHRQSLLIFQGLALLAYQINRLFLIEATFAYGSLTKDLEVVTHKESELA